MKSKPTIMVVDDDVAILDILKQSLVMEGYHCAACTCGEDALESLQRQPVDILLTDIVMPGMRGLELVSSAKRLYPGLTVLVMTGFLEEFTYNEAMRAGAADFIKKPFAIQELVVRIRHAKMQEHLRELSITDELTGLSNRRGFFAFAQQQLKLARRRNERLVLLYADLDNLKAINDTLGHLAGDRALADAALILRETCRDTDIVARMGGDEFAVVLVQSAEENLAVVRERLFKRLDEYNSRKEAPFRLSLSMGISVFKPDKLMSVDDLVREADSRMYEEKQRKRAADGP